MGLTPGTRIGAYELVASLGAAGMGEVYRARDTRLERTVALNDGRALYYRRGATLYRVPVEQAGTALKFGMATQIYAALPAVKGDHRAFGVFSNGDALVLRGASGDRSDHLNLFEHWTAQGLGIRE